MTLDGKIKSDILPFLAENLDLEIERLKDSATLSSLEIDSLDTTALIVRIEEEYQFTIPKEYAITTIRKLVSYIYKNSPRYKK